MPGEYPPEVPRATWNDYAKCTPWEGQKLIPSLLRPCSLVCHFSLYRIYCSHARVKPLFMRAGPSYPLFLEETTCTWRQLPRATARP